MNAYLLLWLIWITKRTSCVSNFDSMVGVRCFRYDDAKTDSKWLWLNSDECSTGSLSCTNYTERSNDFASIKNYDFYYLRFSICGTMQILTDTHSYIHTKNWLSCAWILYHWYSLCDALFKCYWTHKTFTIYTHMTMLISHPKEMFCACLFASLISI